MCYYFGQEYAISKICIRMYPATWMKSTQLSNAFLLPVISIKTQVVCRIVCECNKRHSMLRIPYYLRRDIHDGLEAMYSQGYIYYVTSDFFALETIHPLQRGNRLLYRTGWSRRNSRQRLDREYRGSNGCHRLRWYCKMCYYFGQEYAISKICIRMYPMLWGVFVCRDNTRDRSDQTGVNVEVILFRLR